MRDQDKPDMTVREAGRLGGNAVRDKYGPGYYSRIGQKGGEALLKKRGLEHYSRIGRLGGRGHRRQSSE